MESIIRNVRDIEADKRQWLEHALGRQLQDNQQVIIRVVTVGRQPAPEVRNRALEEASRIASRSRAHAAAQGVDGHEADASVDEAIQHVRHENS